MSIATVAVPDETKSLFVLKYGYPVRTKEWLDGLPNDIFRCIFPHTPWGKDDTIQWYISRAADRYYKEGEPDILFANTIFSCYHRNYKPFES